MSTTDPPQPIPGARLLFSLDPAVAYLNHGAFGAVPIGVQRAQQRLRDEMEANPVRFFTVGLQEREAHVRAHLANFLGADPDLSALVDNATTGVALALNTLELKPGDEVVTTNHGYGAVRLAVDAWCRRTGTVHRVAKLPLSPDDDTVIAAVRKACSGSTRCIITDAIASATAHHFPSVRLAALSRELGVPLVVDAAHAPATLTTPVREIGADFWVGNLHKWAFAPRGTALFCVAPRWRERIRPLAMSWHQDEGFPANVEFGGVRDYTPWLAAPTGLFTLRQLGVDRVREHNIRLAAYGQQVLGRAVGTSELPDNPEVPMRLIPLPAGVATEPGPARALRDRISDELGVETSVQAFDGRGVLRICAQVYNQPAEYERLAVGLRRLL